MMQKVYWMLGQTLVAQIRQILSPGKVTPKRALAAVEGISKRRTPTRAGLLLLSPPFPASSPYAQHELISFSLGASLSLFWSTYIHGGTSLLRHVYNHAILVSNVSSFLPNRPTSVLGRQQYKQRHQNPKALLQRTKRTTPDLTPQSVSLLLSTD